MTGCCAVGCRNKSENGCKLYRIPSGKRNEERRKVWLMNINRNNFSSDQGKLCEAHFDRNQFEPLVPGKLKPNAVPTIFPPLLLVTHDRPPCKRVNLLSDESAPLLKTEHIGLDHSYCDTDSLLAPGVPHNEDITDIPLAASMTLNLKSLLHNLKPLPPYEDIEALKIYIHDLREKYLELEMENQTLIENLSMFLNPDQLQYLKGNSCKHWSDDTIKKALEIESSCGYSGYQTLIEQGYPLPPYKTLFIRTSGTFSLPPAS